MKAIALAFVAGSMAMGCTKMVLNNSISGSGKPGTRTVAVGAGKTISDFKKIEHDGALAIEVKTGPQSDLVVTGDDNLINLIEFSNSGDTLVVKSSEQWSENLPLKVTVTVPDLQGVSLNGSGDVTADGLKGDEIAFSIGGSGHLKATGVAKTVDASIDGSGHIDLAGLAAPKAKASISGSGAIDVNATDSLDASISGSGTVRYKGSPKNLAKSISGSGEISSIS